LLQPETKHFTRPGIAACGDHQGSVKIYEKNLLFIALGIYHSQITTKQCYVMT
jgi:hypothetical protein